MNAPSENWAGKGTREIAEKRRKLRKDLGLSSLMLMILASVTFLAYSIFGHADFTFTIGGLIFIALLAGKIDRTIIPVMDELQAWEGKAVRGARAEEKIGDLLDSLSGDWVVLHDINKARGNIDHLVFRKDGALFLIETKSHQGKIAQAAGQLCRNGHPLEKNFIAQTHGNILWLKEFLKTRRGIEPRWIHAAIVFSNAYVEKHLEVKGVALMNARFLLEWMRRQPGSPQMAAALGTEIETLKKEFSAGAPNHLAPPTPLG